jgi:hypothetical protein
MKIGQGGQRKEKWEQGNKARKYERDKEGQAGKKEMSGRNLYLRY